MMRRMALLCMLALLAGCTTSDVIEPMGAASSASISTRVALAYPRFDDNKPHEWQAKKPTHYAVHGTDVSKYQRSIDWHTAKRSGISFAFVKATEGGDRVDDYFDEHWSSTRAAGVPREKGSLPPILDMEWNPDSPTCKLRPPAATVRSEMKTFLEIVERHYGKKPIIYTSIDFFDDNALSTFRGYPYWLRSVAGHPTEKYGEHPFTFWQYTGTGVVPGIRGNADINVFNGSATAWNKWLRANTH